MILKRKRNQKETSSLNVLLYFAAFLQFFGGCPLIYLPEDIFLHAPECHLLRAWDLYGLQLWVMRYVAAGDEAELIRIMRAVIAFLQSQRVPRLILSGRVELPRVEKVAFFLKKKNVGTDSSQSWWDVKHNDELLVPFTSGKWRVIKIILKIWNTVNGENKILLHTNNWHPASK